ncbi:MAG: alanine:cation symporter family protein, partial [Bacteroidales bacterium]
MQDIQLFFNKLSGLLWGWPMIILLLGTHIFLTIRLKFPQRKIFKGIALSVKSDGDSKGDVSQFGALATALAATIGTGNIIGVATAVSLGGPGAVLWIWLSGLFGIATKYSEGLLAVKYRVKTSDGTMLGGPMYALERGLGMKWLAVLFCIFTIVAALGIGCSVQSNSISTMLRESINLSPYISGGILALMVALVIFFGIKGIARVCGFLVPFMAFFYVLGCIVIILMNASFLGKAVSLIFESAFSLKAVGGGLAGG